MYRLEYLPLASQDMVDIVRYVSQELRNPQAAERLATDLVDAGESISSFPYVNSAYIPIRPLKHEYRKLLVKSYIMFYWVDETEKLVTIARVVYGKRNFKQLLE